MSLQQALTEVIREQIGSSPGKAVTFRDYMELCLYHPEYGYYMKPGDKIGRSGDFYTSSSIGGIFGEVLARFVAEQAAGRFAGRMYTVAEWGGGSGLLARQLLDELRRSAKDAYERLAFVCVEASPHHRGLQADQLADHAGKVSWLTEEEWLAAGPWDRALIYSNELLDAFPVHRLQVSGGQLCEIYVEWDDTTGRFRDKLVPLRSGPLVQAMRSLDFELPEGRQLELNPAAAAWLRRIAASLQSGLIVTIDYGDREEELYAAHRMRGTLICYRRHQAEDHPYLEPGGQDMTSHINFTDLMREGSKAGLVTDAYTTQKQFLVDYGVLELLRDTASADPFGPAARRNRAIRQLLLSDQMSELFKVLIQKKDERP